MGGGNSVHDSTEIPKPEFKVPAHITTPNYIVELYFPYHILRHANFRFRLLLISSAEFRFTT